MLAEVSTGSQVDSGCYHRGSTLLACVGGDRAVRVFDASASPPRRVRVFAPHGDRITDLTFSQDAKWLITACMDGLVRVWDVPSARLLQSLRVGEPVTSLSLSPGSELLATSHVGKRCGLLRGCGAEAHCSSPTRPDSFTVACGAKNVVCSNACACASSVAPQGGVPVGEPPRVFRCDRGVARSRGRCGLHTHIGSRRPRVRHFALIPPEAVTADCFSAIIPCACCLRSGPGRLPPPSDLHGRWQLRRRRRSDGA